jgi:hypothetical protein
MESFSKSTFSSKDLKEHKKKKLWRMKVQFGCPLFVFADIMSGLCNPSIGYLWSSLNSVQCDVLF